MSAAFQLLNSKVQQKLWDMKWTELRPIQVRAILHLVGGGGDCIVSSATASGKTEAAFLPVLSAIADETSSSVHAMYIGPLKALINDQFRRVEDLCARMTMPVHKWHGDVGQAERRALLETPRGVLLITPESLEAMFVLRPTKMPAIFGGLRYVVIDELHAFIGTERGAQLLCQLGRLRARTGCDPVRIGLSATLADPSGAAAWLRPRGPSATVVADDAAPSAIAILVRGLWRHAPLPGDADQDADPAVTEVARRILLAGRGRTNLVFANAKAHIELLADELAAQAKAMNLPDEIVVHHGSLSKDRREYAEARLRAERPCTAVCSNTLELGIDIGEIDEVVQVSAPWSVASLVQRLGRSGRRAGGRRTLRGYFVESAPDERADIWDRLHLPFVQGIATIELMLEKYLEPLETQRSHLSTLVHQILSTLAETGGIAAAPLYTRLVGSGAFATVERGEFATLLRELAAHDLVEQMPDGSLVLGVSGQKLTGHYSFYAAFNAPEELAVVHGTESIGTIAHAPPPGEHLILAGRRWRVEEVDAGRREVVVTPARGRRAPFFTSRRASSAREVHRRMRALLAGAASPAYLDDGAREILASARAAAERSHRFRPAAQAFDDGVRVFVFDGGRVQQTLAIALARSGIVFTDHGVGFDLEAAPADLRGWFESFAASPDIDALAAFADEKMRLRQLGREKFEAVLPADLWRQAFVREDLDVGGAAAVAAELAAALRAASPPVRRRVTAARTSLAPLAGVRFGGSSLTEHGDLAPGEASLGRPVWSPLELLRDLELRLALVAPQIRPATRVQQWARRMRVTGGERFYSASFRADPIGSATTVLAMRDELVENGWNGEPIPGGGERLDALVELESASDVAPGPAERLRRVEEQLRAVRSAPIVTLFLADAPKLWPARWRRVFALLEALGTQVQRRVPSFEPAAADDDLGRVQAALRGEKVAGGLRGDGSIVLLRGETSWELSEALAALLRAGTDGGAVVVRGGDAAPLEQAFALQGLPSQGVQAVSSWRPVLQLLPLAIDLAFEPRDPHRVLELVTLPMGPFEGVVGRRLATALSEAPGIGGPRWQDAKEKARASLRDRVDASTVEERLNRVYEWLEEPGLDERGAPRSALIAVAERVRTWISRRITAAHANEETGVAPLLCAALADADAFLDALRHEERDVLDRIDARLLVQHTLGGHTIESPIERAGRIDHVSGPASLRRSRDLVVWWHCVAGTEWTPAARIWRRAELDALAAAGVGPVDPGALLAAEAESWRQVVLAARRRLVIAVPRFAAGRLQTPHPMWDELKARIGAGTADEARVTLEAGRLLQGEHQLWRGTQPELLPTTSLPLPEARTEWRITPSVVVSRRYTATQIDALVGCPLRSVLRDTAQLRERLASIPRGPHLFGRLGHRLVEELHRAGAFARPFETAEFEAHLGRLLRQEGATLLMPGMSFERAQVKRQLRNAVDVLADLLVKANLTVVDVESDATVAWRSGELAARLDLVLRDRDGRDVVLDLKWGRSTYRKQLEAGLAVQLAAYAAIRRLATGGGTFPVAAYFALQRGEVLVVERGGPFVGARPIEGESLRETWDKLERTVDLVERQLAAGKVAVTGVTHSLPLLDSARIDGGERGRYLDHEVGSQCNHCSFGPICGRSWSEFA